jgi:adenylate kinase family enzyme
MIVGQPGAGKSVLARAMGEITRLPVHHVDHIHWLPGWVERAGPEKDRLARAIEAREEWIFEGGRSATWAGRLDRADTLIWLELPVATRMLRVLRRTVTSYGRNRPDLPDGCREHFSTEFLGYIWRTRHSGRARILALWESVPPGKARHRFTARQSVARYLADLARAVREGNLGRPHR